ncbi:hypothetical protein O9993_19250 [Vibrio lentus]|nr:hypothetical protein [Vibrio lentus]
MNIDTLVAMIQMRYYTYTLKSLPTDPDDHMSSLKISGLLAGTVLVVMVMEIIETISNMQQAIEIKRLGFRPLNCSAPGGNKHNMNIELEATTSGSSGDVTSQSSSPLILDPNPIPNTADFRLRPRTNKRGF